MYLDLFVANFNNDTDISLGKPATTVIANGNTNRHDFVKERTARRPLPETRDFDDVTACTQ